MPMAEKNKLLKLIRTLGHPPGYKFFPCSLLEVGFIQPPWAFLMWLRW